MSQEYDSDDFYKACTHDNLGLVRSFLNRQVKQTWIVFHIDNGLKRAAKHDSLRVVTYLCEKAHDLQDKDAIIYEAFKLACEKNSIESITHMIEHEAQPAWDAMELALKNDNTDLFNFCYRHMPLSEESELHKAGKMFELALDQNAIQIAQHMHKNYALPEFTEHDNLYYAYDRNYMDIFWFLLDNNLAPITQRLFQKISRSASSQDLARTLLDTYGFHMDFDNHEYLLSIHSPLVEYARKVKQKDRLMDILPERHERVQKIKI